MKISYLSGLLLLWISFFLCIGTSRANSNYISILNYDEEYHVLSINVVAPSGDDKLYLKSDNVLTEIRRVTKVGDHLLKVYLPCEEISNGDGLYYQVDNLPPLFTSLDGIQCKRNNGLAVKKPRVIYQHDQCYIDHKGTTLWRVGTVLNEMNGFTIYQNMYGVYLTNKSSFIKGELSKMTSDVLRCPSTALLSTIDAQHAKAMFHEYEDFRKSSQ
ncbi:hypothetical protein [Aeromonas salmonicida]|uniref:hypothetical protein n=1 Tax=Aeromonas salmonicida TaxID=645 RepID=UPI003D24BB4E